MTAPHRSESAPVEFFAPVVDVRDGLFQRGLSGGLVVAVHVVILALLIYAAVRPEVTAPIRALAVRLIEPELPKLPKLEPPKQVPPQPAPKKVQTPPPIMTAAKRDDAPTSFVVAPQPAPVAAPAVQAPVAAPITAARFDADYLQNAKPIYPAMSRRLGDDLVCGVDGAGPADLGHGLHGFDGFEQLHADRRGLQPQQTVQSIDQLRPVGRGGGVVLAFNPEAVDAAAGASQRFKNGSAPVR